MDDETAARALDAIERGEKLVRATTKLLAEQGFIEVTKLLHLLSPEPEHLAISITEKGQQLLKRRGSLNE